MKDFKVLPTIILYFHNSGYVKKVDRVIENSHTFGYIYSILLFETIFVQFFADIKILGSYNTLKCPDPKFETFTAKM